MATLTKDDVKGQVVRVSGEKGFDLFLCSSIEVGSGMAGEWIDGNRGDVVYFDRMTEVVDPDEADKELLRFRVAKDKDRIREVVKSVDDAQKEFEGTIVLHVSFQGSLPKSKALTKEEKRLTDTEMAAAGIDPKKIKGAKTLFSSDEYDELESFESKRRKEFSNMGIPFPLGDSMHLIRLVNIPEAETLAAKTEVELKALVKKLQEKYPSQITPEAVGLGPLYNPNDYKKPEALETLFKFKIKWMHFGVPEILKEIDLAAYERERQRTAAVWQEAKEQGLLLLRKTMSEMVNRLVDTVTPGQDGVKKKFYATAVTNLTDFFESFENRNLAGDTRLAEEVQRLKSLIEGKDLKQFKDDEVLRQTIQKAGSDIGKRLESMVVEAGDREFNFAEG